MKKLISLLLLFSLLSLFSCAEKLPDYSEYHTDENSIGTVTIGSTRLEGFLFTLESGEGRIEFTKEGSKKAHQAIPLPLEGEYYTLLESDYARQFATYQDMNFDGCMDLYVPCCVSTANLEGMAWLWDDGKKEFVLSEELSALYELTVYADDELITSQDYSDPAGVLCREYKWIDGILTKTGEYTMITN